MNPILAEVQPAQRRAGAPAPFPGRACLLRGWRMCESLLLRPSSRWRGGRRCSEAPVAAAATTSADAGEWCRWVPAAAAGVEAGARAGLTLPEATACTPAAYSPRGCEMQTVLKTIYYGKKMPRRARCASDDNDGVPHTALHAPDDPAAQGGPAAEVSDGSTTLDCGRLRRSGGLRRSEPPEVDALTASGISLPRSSETTSSVPTVRRNARLRTAARLTSGGHSSTMYPATPRRPRNSAQLRRCLRRMRLRWNCRRITSETCGGGGESRCVGAPPCGVERRMPPVTRNDVSGTIDCGSAARTGASTCARLAVGSRLSTAVPRPRDDPRAPQLQRFIDV